MSTFKPSKLNKTQLAEFAKSAISEGYALCNFYNIPKSKAPILLNASSPKDISLKGTALDGGWTTYDLSVFKPKVPRTSQGKLVKYESLKDVQLIEVRHPEGVAIDLSQPVYFVEGMKKAVSVAEATKARVFCFEGLSVGIHLADQMNSMLGNKRIIFDNDSKITAVKCARSLASKLSQDFEIAIFNGFKGIDDALAAGVPFSEIRFIPVDAWSASLSGYVDANTYTFSSAQFHDVEIPASTKLVILQAGKGTGKTWYMSQLAKKRQKLGNIFVLTHRINLSRANAKKLAITYVDDDNYKDNGGSVGLCIDSILKIKQADCVGATIFIDEFCQVLDHLINSDTLKNKRSKIIQRFGEILHLVRETNGMIVVADADADEKSVSLLKELGGFSKEDCFLLKNTFVFKKGFARHSLGVSTLTSTGNVSKRKRPVDVIAKILSKALAGKRLFCCLSAQQVLSKYSTQVIEQFLITNGVASSDILRIDSETIGDSSHAAYKAAERINELCAKYPIILASPSLNTGVDIQYKGFDYVIGIASGTLDSNGTRQFLSRVRDWDCERILYAPNKRQNFGDNPITNQSDLEQLKAAHEQSLKLFDEDWYAEINGTPNEKLIPATKDYFLKQAWEKQRESFEYAKRINQGLITEGFTVETFNSEISIEEATEVYEQLKEIQEDLDNARKLLVQEKEITSEDDAKKLYEATFTTIEEKCGLKGYEIRKQLNLAPTPELQKHLDNGVKAKLENNFAATEGFEISQQLWQKEQFWKAERNIPESASDFVKRNLRPARIKALHKVGFFNKILKPFNSGDANCLLAELRKDKLNKKLFPELQKETKYAIKAVKAIARKFNFKVVEAKQNQNGKRSYIAIDEGFELSDGFEGKKDVKPHIFEFWTEKRKKQADDWQAFKRDIYKVKLGQRLDNSKSLPKLSEDFKYSKLSTRAKTLTLPKQPDYRIVCNQNILEFKQLLAAIPEIAIDCETYGKGEKGGLNHIRGSIRLIQFATTDTIWIVEQSSFDLIRHEIMAFLENPKQRKIGHNLMFDLRFLRKEFGVLARNCADTMLGSRCLMGDMGAAQITNHSLQQACENFLGVEVDKAEQKSDWGGNLSSEQFEYAAKDPWLTFVLYKRLEELTKNPSLLLLPLPKMLAYEAWEVENRFLFAAQQMEDTGYEIDIELLAETKAKYQTVRNELSAQWKAPYAPTQKTKLKGWLNEKYGLNLKSLGKATVAENGNIPELKLMQQICACEAILHTLNSIQEQVDIFGGRVKPYFKVLSGTGRTSSGATKVEKCLINLQSLAARVNPILSEFDLPKLKSLFTTNLIIDLPASHGRISAELGNDENALKAYMDETIDMHCGTAAAVAKAVFPDENYTAKWIQTNKKNDPVAKGLRDTAKNTYYGWLNGAGVSTIQRQIRSNLQINADKLACQKALQGLQDVFSGTTDFAKSKLKELDENRFVINGVVCGWMEFAGTYLCWRLGAVGGDLKVPATKAFAGIWSRTESLLMKRSCYRIAEKFDSVPEWNSRLQNFIHDEINAEIGCDEAASFAHSVVEEEFGKLCTRTVVGFDPLSKCYPLNNWSDK